MRSRVLFTLLAGCGGLSAASAPQARATDTIVYQVRRGDTLSGLAGAFLSGRESIEAVARLNGIRDMDRIFTGRYLRIPRRVLRDEPATARIEAFSGDIMLNRSGSALPVKIGAELAEATGIVTGRNSFLTLRLADGSVVSIPSQTSFRLLRLRRVPLTGTVEREFGLERGRVRAKVTPMKEGDSTFRVRTPVGHAAVRGTVFRTGYDPETRVATTEVDEGKVAVAASSRKGERLILPTFGIASGGASDSGVVPLLAAPVLIDPGRTQSSRELQFSIEPVAGAGSYRLEIARDAGILDLLEEVVADAPTFTLPALPAGDYFVRLSAIDANGLEGVPGTYAFRRRRNGLVGAMLQSGTGRKARYQFKWEAETDGTPLFRFQLRRLSDAAPMVDEIALRDRELSVTGLPPGEYTWRVLSALPDATGPIEGWSEEQRFVVAKSR